MAPAAVELHDISHSIAHQRVLDHVSLTVQAGEFFALLGPSGCGKTTTLRLVAGFDRPTAGDIWVHGQSMAGIPPYRRDVNLVFQHYALFPHRTVRQNISFGLEMQRLPRREQAARTTEALELVRLHGLEHRYPHQLSGGEQQRVALARALARQPSVLLLDEPLGALDLYLRKAMQRELKQLQRRLGITFIYVTHDQEEALTMADRIAVMQAGRIMQVGSPTEIYEGPTTRFVASFIGETNLLNGRVIAVESDILAVEWCHTVLHTASSAHLKVDAGDAVTLAVRPEQITLCHASLPAPYNCLPAVVEEAIYRGADTRYFVRLNESVVLCSCQQNLGSHRPFVPGENVFACFTRHAVHALHESPPS